MSDEKKREKKSIFVTAFPNIVPAGVAITKKGEGTTLPIAIGRAVDAIFEDDRLKGKRQVLPIRLFVNA
jgi:hypothetical protein